MKSCKFHINYSYILWKNDTCRYRNVCIASCFSFNTLVRPSPYHLFIVYLFKSEECDIKRLKLLIPLQEEICNGTMKTLKRVKLCPENYLNFQNRSKTMNCDSYPQCSGQGLFYHCVKFEDGLAEVCAPRSVITGTVYVQVYLDLLKEIIKFSQKYKRLYIFFIIVFTKKPKPKNWAYHLI